MAEEPGNSSWGRRESDSEQLSTRHNQKLFLIYKGKKRRYGKVLKLIISYPQAYIKV